LTSYFFDDTISLWWRSRGITEETPTVAKEPSVAEGFNFSFLQANVISSMQELHVKVTAMQTEYYGVCSEIAFNVRKIDGLNKRLSMWKQYANNKVFHQNLTNLKPRARGKFLDAHGVSLVLYDASVWYLDELKASCEKNTPKHWQAETEHLAAHIGELYQKMKDLRTDIQAVEKSRRTADEIARAEKSKDYERDYETIKLALK